ncbi:MAG: hypothetical protein CMP10_03045 [Zetaproteobacteria bacterium]|nr:hypothetical protein [Pseudobdellovibrionaceae bacterium]|tara:strand:- start:320 stop:790 length:471 start_codon:yes stop_codon:yes gene_type:complete
MKTLNQWLDEYGVSHQNRTNKIIHWICVPFIMFTVIGLLWAIPTNPEWGLAGNPGIWAMVLANLYYLILSPLVFLLMVVQSLIMVFILQSMTAAGLPVAMICAIGFVLAWILQFIGHNIEGKKPSFIKDVQFLLIGPAWVSVALLKKLKLAPSSLR